MKLKAIFTMTLGTFLAAGCAADAGEGVYESTDESKEAITTLSGSCSRSSNGRTLTGSATLVDSFRMKLSFASYPYRDHNDAKITVRRPDGSWFTVVTPDNMLYDETRTFDIRDLTIVAWDGARCSKEFTGSSRLNGHAPGNVYTVEFAFDVDGKDPTCKTRLVF